MTPDQDAAVTLGVLGGGQLGRMFVHAAQSMGFRTVVLDPDGDSPAGRAADRHIRCDYRDESGLADLAWACSAVTTEFENVPATSLGFLASRTTVAPAAAAVRVCQHRASEKAYFQRAGVPCAPHAAIQVAQDLDGDLGALLPGILKTSQLGYDGKGQVLVDDRVQLKTAWRTLGEAPCVLEQRLALKRELSVLVARGADGTIVNLPVQQNLHRHGILAVTQVPAPDISTGVAAAAIEEAKRLAHALDYVGVLCVEFFLLQDGSLVANEMAPRPHNSGHYSIDACDLSQFDLQVRTLARLPLVQPRQHSPAVMLNLLGDIWFHAPTKAARGPDWSSILSMPGVHLHLYGKAEARPGRKMGHLTVTAADMGLARAVAAQAAAALGMPAFD